ncbi:MAG: permease [Candidatus Krumholzibacteriia bacterium]
MKWRREWRPLLVVIAGFLLVFNLPLDWPRLRSAIFESLWLVRWYAREHVVLCLVPAFFIAGAISVFVSQASVMRYLGPRAPKPVAYGVASVSGTVLAVCSCTVLPLFAGIYRMGAGLGPATAFLYAGPAINVLAIILTARVLGVEIGVARAVGAVAFSVVIGLAMHLIFRRGERERTAANAAIPLPDGGRPLWQTVLQFVPMVALLIFATWGRPDAVGGWWHTIHGLKWWLAGGAAALLGLVLVIWYGLTAWKLLLVAVVAGGLAFVRPDDPQLAFGTAALVLGVVLVSEGGELREWAEASWGFARQILPLLLLGVLVAGLLLGRPGQEGLVPSWWVAQAVGGNSAAANLFASVAGAFMYFATLTEVPILQGLLGAGMGAGPALALLLAGPAVSLPSILVMRSIVGDRKTAVFIVLVVAVATVTGLVFGSLFG